MTTHSCIDSKFCGIATGVRRWFNMDGFSCHTEAQLSRRGYLSFGIGLFDEEDDFSIHLRLIWIWMSFNCEAKWQWVRRIRALVRGSLYAEREVISLSYFEHSVNFKFWWTECDRAKWRGVSTHVNMPWHHEWVSTEILSLDLEGTVYLHKRKDGVSWDARHKAEDAAKAENSFVYPYKYTLKSGEEQVCRATVHVVRRSWGYRWLPLAIHSCTSIDVSFDKEVGERTGSWKGGTVGCGYDMKPGESPRDTIVRMERERKFN